MEGRRRRSPGQQGHPPLNDQGWLLAEGVRRVVASFRRDLEEHPKAASRKWWVGLTILLASAAGLVLAMPQLMMVIDGAGWLGWESHVVSSVERWPIGFGTALLLDALASPFFLIPLVVACATGAVFRRKPLLALVILASYFVVSLPVMFGWFIWPRPRPEAVLGGLSSPGFSAFPSGHVTQATAVYGTLAALWIVAARRLSERLLSLLLVIVIVAAVSIARLRLGVHWPTDVVAGLILGSLWTFGSVWLLRYSGSGIRPRSPMRQHEHQATHDVRP